MTNRREFSVADAFAEFKEDLKLSWVTGNEGGERQLTSTDTAAKRPRLLGPLNFNSPNRIQLIGPAEARLFNTIEDMAPSRFEYSLHNSCELFIVTDATQPPLPLLALANDAQIPLFITPLPYSKLQRMLRYRLTLSMAESEIVHGVLLDVHGTGVLLIGEPSVGKSEVALELISRGHILVADDAPEFRRIAPGTIEGRCPPVLQDFLEVRGLGILNIARMYGEAQTRNRKILRFIVRLRSATALAKDPGFEHLVSDRLHDNEEERDVLGISIPQRTIPVAPGRNLAVLVEAAVREHILRAGGYSATNDLIARQALAIEKS